MKATARGDELRKKKVRVYAPLPNGDSELGNPSERQSSDLIMEGGDKTNGSGGPSTQMG